MYVIIQLQSRKQQKTNNKSANKGRAGTLAFITNKLQKQQQ